MRLKKLGININNAQQGDAPETASPRIIPTAPSRKIRYDAVPVIFDVGRPHPQFALNINAMGA